MLPPLTPPLLPPPLKVLARGEKIELLVNKTDRLSQQAVQFKR